MLPGPARSATRSSPGSTLPEASGKAEPECTPRPVAGAADESLDQRINFIRVSQRGHVTDAVDFFGLDARQHGVAA
jgi:hypothetical protein